MLINNDIWLTQNLIAELFGVGRSTITEHINNILNSGELDENNTVGKTDVDNSKKPVKIYNLDMIIAVGYRVNSKKATKFRIWATKILKDYMIKGYAVNQKRLEYLEKTIKLIDIANRIDEKIENNDAQEILKVIGSYSKALDLLDDYDHRTLLKPKGNNSQKQIKYEECLKIINKLRFNEESDIFAIERNKGLEAVIGNIYQTFDNNDVYKSIEEKASNFLYMIIKNHVFIDGNKRIAATLFIYFLNYYDILYKDNKQIIDNNTLTALTLLIAESNPKEIIWLNFDSSNSLPVFTDNIANIKIYELSKAVPILYFNSLLVPFLIEWSKQFSFCLCEGEKKHQFTVEEYVSQLYKTQIDKYILCNEIFLSYGLYDEVIVVEGSPQLYLQKIKSTQLFTLPV